MNIGWSSFDLKKKKKKKKTTNNELLIWSETGCWAQNVILQGFTEVTDVCLEFEKDL